MKLNQSVADAVLALDVLWRQRESSDEFHSAISIARQAGISEAYAVKLLRGLANSGIIEKQTGRNGGFKVLRTPESTSLLAVIEAVGSRVDLESSVREAADKRIALGFTEVSTRLRRVLQQITLDVLVGTDEY